MKVERQTTKPTFDPIVITLETEEEASHLWHKLNNTHTIWIDYCRKRNIPNNTGAYGLNFKVWEALNRVFQPADDC